jgi:hypothetical protein
VTHVVTEESEQKRRGAGPRPGAEVVSRSQELAAASAAYRVAHEGRGGLPAHAVLALQRTAGNRAVNQLLRVYAARQGAQPVPAQPVREAGMAAPPPPATTRHLPAPPPTRRARSVVAARKPMSGKTPVVQRQLSDEGLAQVAYEQLNEHFTGSSDSFKVERLVRAQENGALFMELVNLPVVRDYFAPSPGEATTSLEEKLHVPATAADVGTRFDILTKLCLEAGIRNFKVAKKDKLENKQSGSAFIFTLLHKNGLIADDEVYNPRVPIAGVIRQALEPERRTALGKFMRRDLTKMPEALIAGDLAAFLDNAVGDAGFFPQEQSGREITVYVLPGQIPLEAWRHFAGELAKRFAAADLERLPIASGDQRVAGEGVEIDGTVHAYFSSRNEANALDETLGYEGFPHWVGGNAEKANAAHQPLIFDEVDVTKLDKPTKKKGRFRSLFAKPGSRKKENK